jgi:uroporphyrinogen-III synthase
MPNPTLLMIRPLAQAQDFVQALNAQTGKSPATVFAPVIETRACAFDPPNAAQFLLFSSVNGVKFFAAQTENRDIPALCVGDTTAKAAQSAGFMAESAGGTAADLLQLVQSKADPQNGPLIYVCGALVAHDLDGQLTALGFISERCVVYEQTPQTLTKQALTTLITPTVIPVFSPNTARIFADQTANQDLSHITFVFISENARAPLSHTNATQILADAPTRDAMIHAVSQLF